MITYSILNDFNMQKDRKMTAKEFEKGLLLGLNHLSKQDINEIKKEYDDEGDYGITIDGQSYWIPPVSSKNKQ